MLFLFVDFLAKAQRCEGKMDFCRVMGWLGYVRDSHEYNVGKTGGVESKNIL
ncbi:MAG: hypothetical protein OEY51_09515 [Cyclobacteriaceae bacterium]|nr:hypothetical protein [Cyclobacteriaceae bacterium]